MPERKVKSSRKITSTVIVVTDIKTQLVRSFIMPMKKRSNMLQVSTLPRFVGIQKKKKNKLSLIAYICLFLLVTAVFIGLPLLQVWKQSYITTISLKQQQLKDSCVIISQKIYQVSAEITSLSKNERIEKIAQTKLNLQYPKTSDIIVLKSELPVYAAKKRNVQFGIALLRSLMPGKG